MMKSFRYIVLLISLVAFTPKAFYAQIDTAFWFAAPPVTPDHWFVDPVAFHFSTFNDTTTIRLQQPASTYDTTFVVLPNTLFSKFVEFMLDSVESKPSNEILRTGFKITSNYPITVVYDVITRSPGNFNPETYSLKGQNGMGTEFVLPFQTLHDNREMTFDLNMDGKITPAKQSFSIVASEDSTTVHITTQGFTVDGTAGGRPPGTTFSVLLPKAGNVYTGENLFINTSDPGLNLAGTVVVSDKPVSITISDDSVNPDGETCFDQLGDQIVPTDVIGKEYIINQGFLNAGSEETAFILGTENFTTVTVDDGTGPITFIINKGETYPQLITEELTYIQSDKPVYVLHMSGYGCELGAAILPPINCSGSDQVSFSRSNNYNFLLNVLCPAGAEDDFTINGNDTILHADSFAIVPGTGGAWLGAQIELSSFIAVNSSNLITNSSSVFSLGVINGDLSSGGLFHYLSSFIQPVIVMAGEDTTACNGEPTINLSGNVSGGVSTGIWSVLNGTGTLNTPTNLTTTYSPSPTDYAQGTLSFVLTSTGLCDPVSDTVVVVFVQSPVVDAGIDNSYCKNNVAEISLNGSLSNAAGSIWSGGNGGAFANNGSLTTTYTPSVADIAADSVTLYLTSVGNIFNCPDDQDTLVVYFTEPPTVDAGSNQIACLSNTGVSLSGIVSGVTTTGIWSSTGAGSFSPSTTDLNGTYLISAADTATGSIMMSLTSTNNGNCNAVIDSFEITIISRPDVGITSADSICNSANLFNLSGNLSNGFAATWTTNGAGTINSPSSLNTNYTVDPADITNGFIDVFLTTDGSVCIPEQDSVRIIFVGPPTASAGTDTVYCENEPIALNGMISGSGSIGSWTSLGTGTFSPNNNILSTSYIPSAADITAGSVSLILTTSGSFGCLPNTDTIIVSFKPVPDVVFSTNQTCLGETTSFTDLSSTTGGSIDSWQYDFGDLSTASTQNPTHQYAASGSYDVTLVTGASNGCSDTLVQAVVIDPLPNANFNYGLACNDMPISFNDLSSIESGSVVGWEYLFETGNTSTSQDPTYTFNTAGTYAVSLTATSDLGCIGSVVNDVVVIQGPTSDFSMLPNPALVLEDVTFTDQSSGSAITNWIWSFGDESGGNNQTEIHNYSDGGTYTVTLTVTDVNGCMNTNDKELTIELLPVLPTGFTPNGDGENDVLTIRGGPFFSGNFTVYNNWGEVVFKTEDISNGWDGNYQGKEAPYGVYTWAFKVVLVSGRVIQKTGDVTLIR